LGEGISPVTALARDEGIDPFVVRLFEFVARAAGDDANGAANLWAAGNDFRRDPQGRRAASLQLLARDAGGAAQADILAFFEKERLEMAQAKRPRELRVIPNLRMGIEWQV